MPRVSRHDDVDVVIVGYGPVGQTLSLALGRAGHRVVALERHHSLYALPRAGHVDHEIIRIFQSLCCAEEVLECCVPARSYELRDAAGALLFEIDRIWDAPSGYLPDYHFYQPHLEAVVDRHVRTLDTVAVHQGWTVDELVAGEPATVVAVDEEGTRRSFSARFVIGADGANSFVRDALGIGLHDFGFFAEWLIVDVRVGDDHPLLRTLPDTTQWCDPERPTTIGLLAGRYIRFEFMLRPGETAESMTDQATVWRLLERWLPEQDGELIRRAVYPFRSLLATEWRRDNVLLAGDAAHVMPPFLGQGLCSGIRDAATLRWMLDLVLRGVVPVDSLDGYEDTRSAHVRSFIEQSIAIGEVVCVTDPEAARRRNEELRTRGDNRARIVPAITAGVVAAAGGVAGTMAVQGRVRRADGGEVRSDDVATGRFTVQALGADPADHLDADRLDFLARIGAQLIAVHPGDGRHEGHSPPPGHLAGTDRGGEGQHERTVHVVDSEGRLERSFAESGVRAVVVRPDFYVFGAARHLEDVGVVVDELRAQLTGSGAMASEVVR